MTSLRRKPHIFLLSTVPLATSSFWLITNCKNGISAYELARSVGVTQKAAWHMLGRIRKAMDESEDAPKLSGAGRL